MAKSIKFNIPTAGGKITQARGVPVWFTIGERKIKFVLQYDAEGKAKYLTHFASGCRFGSLDDAHVELMCRLSPYHRFTKRQLGYHLIAKIVARMGVDFVLEKIDNASVIN